MEFYVRRLALVMIASSALLTGCRATGEALFDTVFDMIWDVGTDAVSDPNRLTDDDKHIARRKGMSDDEYHSLKREEQQWREFREE
jgi:hypothetical protein